MRNKDLEPAHHLRQWDRTIALPLLDGLGIIHHDDEVLLLALVVDLGLGSVAAGHCDEVLLFCGLWGASCEAWWLKRGPSRD